MQYFEELCKISKSWAKRFRTEKLIRGSNTNNYIEAQFLVVDMLFDKLLVEIEDYFKRRLLSVADRAFDGIYSHRFKGSNFKSCLGICNILKLILILLWQFF